MKKFQQVGTKELIDMLVQRNYWTRIHKDDLLSKEQARKPSTIIQGGTSVIISYYDEHGKYLCTIHRVITTDGTIIHNHVKDAFIDGVWYKAKD